ncbi:MAG: hypothetical protein AAF934_10960 [Bacteroidota bacterium]
MNDVVLTSVRYKKLLNFDIKQRTRPTIKSLKIKEEVGTRDEKLSDPDSYRGSYFHPWWLVP